MSIVQKIQTKNNSLFGRLQKKGIIWIAAMGLGLFSFCSWAALPTEMADHNYSTDSIAGDYDDGNSG